MENSTQGTGAARQASSEKTKVAIACQGGGMHAAFEVGVLFEILQDMEERNKIELVGLSGTSAGALCALIVWYCLAPKSTGKSSPLQAANQLNRFWDDFVANTDAELVLNQFTYDAFRLSEAQIFGINAPVFARLNPYGALFKAVATGLPILGVRKQYFDLDDMLAEVCPEFDSINWNDVTTRLLIGATEIVEGFETVFDSSVNGQPQLANKGKQHVAGYWHQRLRLTLSGVAASGTLPIFREAERIKGMGCYWDGLYSQNPPVREFFQGVEKDEVPDELWVLRINPQQWPEIPETNRDVQDRENELMGNLSLHKELDFILTVNKWLKSHREIFGAKYKPVTVRTIKMTQDTANDLSYSSKFNRSCSFMNRLRDEGHTVGRKWLNRWANDNAGEYPVDAGY